MKLYIKSNKEPFTSKMLSGPQAEDELYTTAVRYLNRCELNLYEKYDKLFEDTDGYLIVSFHINCYPPYRVIIGCSYNGRESGETIGVIRIDDNDIADPAVYKKVEEQLGSMIEDFLDELHQNR